MKLREMRSHLSTSVNLTIGHTAEIAEIAEIKKNFMKIPSAFLCELSGPILSFIFRSNRR